MTIDPVITLGLAFLVMLVGYYSVNQIINIRHNRHHKAVKMVINLQIKEKTT